MSGSGPGGVIIDRSRKLNLGLLSIHKRISGFTAILSLSLCRSKMIKCVAFVVVVAITLLMSFTCAEIKDIKFISETRSMIMIDKFGFTHTGHAFISISEVTISAYLSPADPSRFGFFFVSDDSSLFKDLKRKPSLCPLDSHHIIPLFTFHYLSPFPHAFNHTYPITSSPDEYSLYFTNCQPRSKVSMTVHTELYNTYSYSGTTTNVFLSAGLTALPTLYLLFSGCYFCLLSVWTYLMCHASSNTALVVRRIRFLMAGLILVKALNLVCAAVETHNVNMTGVVPHGWGDVVCYVFQFVRDALFLSLLFAVIAVIGTTGWSLQKKVLIAVILLQMIANLPFVNGSWNQVFLLVDVVCCCTIMIPITWSIKFLRETSKKSEKAERDLARLTLVRQFYIVVIGYLYFTRFVVVAFRSVAAYDYRWVCNGAEEVASLAFFMVCFYRFRPVQKNDYFVLYEEEALEIATA